MAWTTPRDWTGISGNIVTAAQLNVDLRDNLNVLSTHTHTGAAGMGSATMSGVTLSALTTLTFADQSANADAAGELQRNGNDLIWYGSSAVNITQADASAGTASLRSLGTTSVKAAAGNHTHTLRQQASTRKDYSDGDSTTDIGSDSGVQVDVIERSISMASAVNALVITVTFNLSACGAGSSVRLAIEEEEGTPSELVTETVTTSDPGTYANMQLHTLHALYLPATTSSITYAGSASPQNVGANGKDVWGTIQISEVTIIPA